jgi:RNA polymerase sigma factor (sigma-70 family)
MPGDNEQEQLDQIIARFLAGDENEHHRLREQVRRYVWRRYGPDRSGHDDLVSEIMHALLVNLRAGNLRGNDLGTFAAYIGGIARHKIRQAIKRADRTASRRVDLNVEEVADRSRRDSSEQTADRDLADKILSALESECRDLLTLKFHRGWSDADIADHKQKSKNAISTAISRCVKKVRNLGFVKEFLY